MGALREYPPRRTPRLRGERYLSLPLWEPRGTGLPNELPQLGLHHGPGQQPVFLGYGDDDGSPHHVVLAFSHIVREAPRPLVAEQGGAFLVGGLLGPRQQRRGLIFVSRLKVLTTIVFLPYRYECPNDKIGCGP